MDLFMLIEAGPGCKN